MSWLYVDGRPGFGDERGAAIVELALAMPVILLLIFGLLQLTLLVEMEIIFDHAAYEGARSAMVGVGDELAAARAARVLSALPLGSGFLAAKPKIALRRGGSRVEVAVSGDVILLPFFRQAAMVAGVDAVPIRAAAARRMEPYLGY